MMIIINRDIKRAGQSFSAGTNVEGLLPEAAINELIEKKRAYRVEGKKTEKPVKKTTKPRGRRKAGTKK